MAVRIPQAFVMSKGQKRKVSINCTDDLGSALLEGTPTVDGPAGLSITDPQVNTSEYTEKSSISGDTVAVGKAIQWRMVAPSDPGEHIVEFSCDTNSPDDDETVSGEVKVIVT